MHFAEVEFVDIVEFAAVVAFAVYGIIRGAERKMDVVGLFAVAFMAAFGGGTVRDLVLNRQPLFWVENSHYTVVVFWLAVFASFFPRLLVKCEKYLVFPDALGLGLWAIAGTVYAQEAGASPFISVLLGVTTGTFGGVLADIICNKVPTIFRKSNIYATCAFVGGYLYLGLRAIDLAENAAMLISITVTVVLRLLAVRYKIILPQREYYEGDEK